MRLGMLELTTASYICMLVKSNANQRDDFIEIGERDAAYLSLMRFRSSLLRANRFGTRGRAFGRINRNPLTLAIVTCLRTSVGAFQLEAFQSRGLLKSRLILYFRVIVLPRRASRQMCVANAR